nr:15028_t:CDS:2 [Entrophospora candida]CAG8648266.1 13001_t:CDS:2 [Entrophospora candida]
MPNQNFITSNNVTTNIASNNNNKIRIEILRKLLVHSDGRDKCLKILQYFSKIILLLHVKKNKSKHPILYSRLTALTTQFSNTRKIIRLAHFLEPYSEFKEYIFGAKKALPPPETPLHKKSVYYLGFLNTIFGIFNDIFDDLYCLGKIGILDKSVAVRAEPIAIRLWFFGIMLDINDIIYRIRLTNQEINNINIEKSANVEKIKNNNLELKLLKDKKFMLYNNLIKLFADFIFCEITGMISGILSFYKLWKKELTK